MLQNVVRCLKKIRYLARPEDPKVIWTYTKHEVRPRYFEVKSRVVKWAMAHLSGAKREKYIEEYAAKMRKAAMECEIKNATADRLAEKIWKASR